jgi:hypothetical protein
VRDLIRRDQERAQFAICCWTARAPASGLADKKNIFPYCVPVSSNTFPKQNETRRPPRGQTGMYMKRLRFRPTDFVFKGEHLIFPRSFGKLLLLF